MWSIFSQICVFIFVFETSAAVDNIINLPNGQIQGRELKTPSGKPFQAYQGVPYAKPPIGELRFQAPQPPENWDGILDTITDTRCCIQLYGTPANQSEDCLYLNVYVPKTNETDMAVLFFIHGGAFRSGSGSSQGSGPDYFIEDSDVILVTINYRLTVFGFLSTEDMVSPGNNGLKDAVMALEWVHSNINLFGGDPNKITIFGESAGSVAVSYLVLSKQTEGLFRAAIHESGTTLNMFNFQRHPKDIAYRVAHYLNSNYTANSTTQEIFDLISNSSIDDLVNATKKVTSEYPEDTFKNIIYGHIFGGVVEPEHDGAIISEKMYEIYMNQGGNKVPQIIGMNSEEAIGNSGNMEAFVKVLQMYDANYSSIVPGPMNVNSSVDKQELGTLIKEIYVGNQTLAENPVIGIRFVSDIWINRAAVKAAKLTSKCADVYFYIFSYMGPLGHSNYDIEGVGHAQELNYLFRMAGVNLDDYPKSDVLTLRRMVRMWNNFAKTLDPTPGNDSVLNSTIWPEAKTFGDDSFLYLDIGPELQVKDNPKSDTLDKWDEIFQKYGNRPFDTY